MYQIYGVWHHNWRLICFWNVIFRCFVNVREVPPYIIIARKVLPNFAVLGPEEYPPKKSKNDFQVVLIESTRFSGPLPIHKTSGCIHFTQKIDNLSAFLSSTPVVKPDWVGTPPARFPLPDAGCPICMFKIDVIEVIMETKQNRYVEHNAIGDIQKDSSRKISMVHVNRPTHTIGPDPFT